MEPNATATTVNEPPSGNDGRLPLNSLEIKNFRGFRHLTIEKLGRVNLITGKNNVGKTTLLEAISVYTKHARPSVLRSLLERRDELGEPVRFAGSVGHLVTAVDEQQGWLPYLGSIFHNRPDLYEYGEPFSIGPVNSDDERLEASVNFYQVNGDGNLRVKEDNSLDLTPLSRNVSFQTRLKARPFIRIKAAWLPDSVLPLEQFFGYGAAIYWTNAEYLPCEFVTTDDSNDNDRRWENIKLNGLTSYVVGALRLIDDRVAEIDFFTGRAKDNPRIPMVKLANGDEFVPLRRMGEGMNRLLRFAVAAPLSKDGILLVDEIENGIHHSILTEVWRFVFRLSKQMGVQVFATTHSWDCIEAFQRAAAEDEDPGSGVLVRLQRDGDDITSTVFDERRLEVVTRRGIEVR